eukprot:gene14239-16801_t
MKTRSKIPINTGLVWSTPNVDNLFTRFLHKVHQGSDGVERYEWKRHDGRHFGEQEIIDRPGNLKLTTTFVKGPQSANGGDWTLRLSGERLNASLTNPYFSMMYYITDESIKRNSKKSLSIDGVTPSSSGGLSGDIQVTGDHPEIGKYTLNFGEGTFLSNHPDVSKWQYYGISRFDEDNWDVVSSIFDESTKRHIQTYYGEWIENTKGGNPKQKPTFIPTLPNIIKPNTNTMVIQRVLKAPFEIEITFVAHSNKETPLTSHGLKEAVKSITGKQFDAIKQGHEQVFNERFQQHYPMNKRVPEHYKVFSKTVLSNLLGGMGYWYGSTLASLDHSNPKKITKLPPVPLFSCTPSRPAFPRGFLWDEGFHQLVVATWDIDLTIETLSHWFNLVNEDGWIPREQILGREALSMVPEEFQVQSPNIANPPTLLLVVNKLMDLAAEMRRNSHHAGGRNNTADILKIETFIKTAYPRIERFYRFYLNTQGAVLDNTFRWRGRKVNHTLASGLDDYPRANPPSTSEIHVDLSSWVAFAAESLSKISTFIGKDGTEFKQTSKDIIKLIELLHWDDKTALYHDVLYNSANNITFTKTAGYINYFPLFLGLVPVDSRRLMPLLDTLKDIRGLWSRHGFRSMSLQDPHYGTNENYWRGPIWININYLFVSQFHQTYMKSGPCSEGFAEMYFTLRHNIIDNIYRVHRDTGFLWEQYHGIEGNGERNHPFTGWTSLVLLMLAEKF